MFVHSKLLSEQVDRAGVNMHEHGGYGQFCPVSMASEILCSRWTTLVIREMLCGSVRFNELRRGVGHDTTNEEERALPAMGKRTRLSSMGWLPRIDLNSQFANERWIAENECFSSHITGAAA